MRRSRRALVALLLVLPGAFVPLATAQTRSLPERVMGATLGPIAFRDAVTGGELIRMRGVGMNTVSLTVWWEADEDDSALRRNELTVSDAELIATIRAVERAGLTTALLPMFHCTGCDSTWRGLTKPADRRAFYADYRAMIEHYARLAHAEGVDVLFLGSELTTLQVDTQEWRAIAASARRHFGGEIAYDVNWDAIELVEFWDAVDVPSVSAYFPLTETARPSVAELKAAWRSSRQQIWRGHDSFAEVRALATRTGKRVLFGEAGYRSREYGARQPFDAVASNGEPSGEVQANAYQALLETFADQPWFRGVLWWDWEIHPAPAADTSFTPRGKPAEQVLRRWYVEGARPAAPAGPSSSSPPLRPSTTRRPAAPPAAVAPPPSQVAQSTTVAPAAEPTAPPPPTSRPEPTDVRRRVDVAAPASVATPPAAVKFPAAVAAVLLSAVIGFGTLITRRRG